MRLLIRLKQRFSSTRIVLGVIERLWDARRRAFDTNVDEFFVLRETMTREEWDVAFTAR